eukprot:20579-Eustigmatos_ZCMA.PRE.1
MLGDLANPFPSITPGCRREWPVGRHVIIHPLVPRGVMVLSSGRSRGACIRQAMPGGASAGRSAH